MAENQNKNDSSVSPNNSPSFNMDDFKTQQALYDHLQGMYNSTKKPVDGSLDKFGEVRLRIGIIDNYILKHGDKIDPLDIKEVINMNSGMVVIKWAEYNGGVLRSEDYGYPSEGYTEPWTYFPDKDSKYPEDRTLDSYNHDKASDKEMIPLTHAFMWSNGSNWSGINYLPPVGSVVVVGFRKNNLPSILGFLQTNYQACKPYLKPGEMMLKGYGSGYTHWRWSNKIDTHVNAKQGDIDIDDPYKKDTYPADIDLWVRYDAFTRNIFIDVDQKQGPGGALRTTVEIKPESLNITSKGETNSTVNISNKDVIAMVNNNKLYVSDAETSISSGDNYFKATTQGVFINSSNIINITGNTININGQNLSVNSNQYSNKSSGDIILSAGGNITTNSSKINLG